MRKCSRFFIVQGSFDEPKVVDPRRELTGRLTGAPIEDKLVKPLERTFNKNQ
jgi:hypothetical protein